MQWQPMAVQLGPNMDLQMQLIVLAAARRFGVEQGVV
jgi:hypothetical protein